MTVNGKHQPTNEFSEKVATGQIGETPTREYLQRLLHLWQGKAALSGLDTPETAGVSPSESTVTELLLTQTTSDPRRILTAIFERSMENGMTENEARQIWVAAMNDVDPDWQYEWVAQKGRKKPLLLAQKRFRW